MKKTTTRLATTIAVLVMSVFAIILAQHDARKSASLEDDLPLQSSHSEPPSPISWPGSQAVVRGNNDDPSADMEHQQAFVEDPNGNPLREPPARVGSDVNDLASVAADLFGGNVVLASGQAATQTGVAAAQLQPLPDSFGENFPTLGAPQPLLNTSGQSSTTNGFSNPAPNAPPPANFSPEANLPNPGSGSRVTVPSESLPSTSPSATAVPVPTFPTTSPASSGIGTNVVSGAPGLGSANLPEMNSQNTSSQSASFANPSVAVNGYTAPNAQRPSELPVYSVPPAQSQNVTSNQPTQSPGLGAVPSIRDPMDRNAADRSANGSSATGLASNEPGSRFLDGSQTPVMQIQKRAPEEITVGKRTTFVIVVRNAGNATAHDVTVVDRVPRGVRFAEASPSVTPASDGTLVWKLGEMAAGDEKTINLQIVPEAEGEIGSVASVHFAAQASVRTMATSPQLDLKVDAGGPVIISQAQQITVTIKNAGTGVAKAVRLEADIPAQLRHESGEAQLEALIGDLRPNESRRLILNVAAVQAGQAACPLRAVNEDGIQAQTQFAVDVRAPQLAATIAGPTRRYLERPATYQVVVSNTGSAVARNLYFEVNLPAGLKFVNADIAQASYHPEKHMVTLGLAELNVGANAAFSVSVMPVELGPQGIRVNASGDLGITAEAKGQVLVEGLSELAFTIGQDNGTVEVGATTTYAVQISNIGNQSDKNVQMVVQLPEGAKLIRVDAAVEHREESGRLIFAPIGEMRSRDAQTFRFQVQHNRAGNQVVRAQLTSANWPVAVLKEEGTLVYNDQ
jgi:uncharacterized repeat protein (TIGR01451 family)